MGLNGTTGPQAVVAVVPAKLTSVRLPQKNVADLGGYPMFYYSVRAARQCPDIEAVYVSSESDELLARAAEYGAETIARPASLSLPEVTNLDVLRHALVEITARRGSAPDLIVLLQPTHPLRLPGLISAGVRLMETAEDAGTLVTVIRSDELHGAIESGRFLPEHPLPRDKKREPEKFRVTGSFYIYRVARTLAQGRFYDGGVVPLILRRPEFEVDVDTAADLATARCVLESHRDEFAGYFPEASAS
jgi:N-acylneuraminate cytidylyltransferase